MQLTINSLKVPARSPLAQRLEREIYVVSRTSRRGQYSCLPCLHCTSNPAQQRPICICIKQIYVGSALTKLTFQKNSKVVILEMKYVDDGAQSTMLAADWYYRCRMKKKFAVSGPGAPSSQLRNDSNSLKLRKAIRAEGEREREERQRHLTIVVALFASLFLGEVERAVKTICRSFSFSVVREEEKRKKKVKHAAPERHDGRKKSPHLAEKSFGQKPDKAQIIQPGQAISTKKRSTRNRVLSLQMKFVHFDMCA